ncbi:hypothetical protein DL766_000911 [Monosporascus sp. MC13-8B]|uniref:Cytochrome P450 n=1 Tax=Monosporascus cannonballus TaxID=155416 RepID=A0ABY0HAY9_9PEZI|nr:hypothetical protein DL762_003297 [Monosporascus cannonballus]RYP00759.1 hypothetical protein DL763_000639 [Monosporascus cannonballus]RYP38494.1 hypothetical protein DL766_000911 [Monosporascus sp. MC13-8B]
MAEMKSLDWFLAKLSSWVSTHGYFPLAVTIILVYSLIRVTYLLWFHPLSKIPGPKLAAVSNVYYGWACSDQGRPTFLKSDLLDDPSKYPGLFSVKDVDEHRAARRIFQPAFNPRLYSEYAPTIDKYVSMWLGKLEKLSASAGGVDMTHWVEYLMADIGGMMAFGFEYRNIESEHGGLLLEAISSFGWWGTLRVALKRFPLLSPLQWFFLRPHMLFTYIKSTATNVQAVADRLKNRDQKRKDYMTPILTEGQPLPPTEYLTAHVTNIVYGHVETSTVATAAVYFLLMHPEVHRKLQQELRDNFRSFDQLTDKALQSIQWLGAVIDETIRLHTNVPYGLPRISPGAEIDGYHIAKGCVVTTCAFATTHSPKYFQKPREFRPERWLPRTHADYDKIFDHDNRSAFRPFSMGSRGCIGQGVAGEIHWERDLRLYTVWQKPPVKVRFHPASPTKA